MVFIIDFFTNIKSWPHHMKRYFIFDKKEQKDYLITTLLFTLIIFFFIWRTTDFSSLNQGLKHLLLIFINVGFFMLLFIFSAKALAIFYFYTAKYSSWLNGLLVGFVVSFISYGLIPMAFPGKIEIQVIDRLRHGRLFFGENKREISFVLTKTLFIIVLASLITKQLFISSNILFFKYSYIIGTTLALMAILPLPDNLGSHLFYVNRTAFYTWFLFLILFYITTIFFTKSYVIILLILSIILVSIFKKKIPIEK